MFFAKKSKKSDTHSAVTQARREIVAAFEIERRRIERDLHDGAQQYLVASAMAIGEAQLQLSGVDDDVRATLEPTLRRALRLNEDALRALRQTVNGIHPKVLSDLGLEYAVRDLCNRMLPSVNVVVPHPLPDLPEGVAAAAYFCVSEGITNVAKYAPGAPTTVLLAADDNLLVSVVDQGPGGATIEQGHGLAGLKERLLAFGGSLECDSPIGGPTSLRAKIPLLLLQGESGIATQVEGDRE